MQRAEAEWGEMGSVVTQSTISTVLFPHWDTMPTGRTMSLGPDERIGGLGANLTWRGKGEEQ